MYVYVALFMIFSGMLMTSDCMYWLIIDFYTENGI